MRVCRHLHFFSNITPLLSKNMDIATVLEIITLIEMKISRIKGEAFDTEVFMLSHNRLPSEFRELRQLTRERVKPLQELRDHLQSFIESQLNAAENSTGE